jgi:PAS domain S-box-containing protein
VRDGHGKAIRAIGAMRDVTQAKLEEARLKLLESVITNINDAVVITDPLPLSRPGPPIIYVNQAFTKMMGYAPEEVIGKSPKILQGPLSDQEELKRLSIAMHRQESCSFSTINYKKNGDIIWVQVTVSPIFSKDGAVQHWIAITRDISESKLAAEAIANQKKFHEDILNHIPSDIAVFNKQHKYLFLNPQAIKNDETRNWLIGKDDFDYCAFKALDTAMAEFRRERFNEVLQTNENVEWVDEHQDKITGEINYVLRKFHPYFEDKELKFVIGYGLDITPRRRMEIQLKETLARMEKTNEELEQFAYVASHDLQEPLRMVSSFLMQLEKKYATVLDERGREYIHFAVDGALRMKQIILDLLEFSRVGRTEQKLEIISIQDVVNEIIALHAAQIQDTNALVLFDQLPEIKGYHAPVRQVFQNLISNSLKYQRPGVQPIIEIKAKVLPQFWQFSVSDNGIGISEKYHQKIFVIFQRLHTKQQYSGTGIGLAITKKIVENLGGTITVHSTEGEGSIFTFTIARNT